jgi:hypothetical protein
MTTPQYTINVQKLSIRDVIALQNAGADIGAQMPIYAKCLNLPEGFDVLDLPATHLKVIAQAIVKEMTSDMGN